MTAKKIIVGVTGGIAAYKSVDLVRRLKEKGYEVQVVMTKAAKDFITPLTLQAVSGHEAKSGMAHIELARWADFILIAPASANFIARLAHGHADDLLSTLCIVTNAPIAVAPAMNQQMWLNDFTQENVKRLQAHNILVFGPGEGGQACGEVGPGRMLEPHELVDLLVAQLKPQSQVLLGKKIIITAGPTHEMIDPVRYLSNRSSGKMGYALAEAAYEAGATVVLISGPCALQSDMSNGIKRIDVVSAEQMYSAVMAEMNACDIFIGAAAVSDYAASQIASQKIKKTAATLTLKLKPNPDILAAVAKLKNRPLTIGFSAETENLIENATTKLKEKNLDMIVANEVGQGQGFDRDDNAATVIHHNGVMEELPLASKKTMARMLITIINDVAQKTKRK